MLVAMQASCATRWRIRARQGSCLISDLDTHPSNVRFLLTTAGVFCVADISHHNEVQKLRKLHSVIKATRQQVRLKCA